MHCFSFAQFLSYLSIFPIDKILPLFQDKDCHILNKVFSDIPEENNNFQAHHYRIIVFSNFALFHSCIYAYIPFVQKIRSHVKELSIRLCTK